MSYNGYSDAQLKRYSKRNDYCCCTGTVHCLYCAGQGKPQFFPIEPKEDKPNKIAKPKKETKMAKPHKHAELIKAWADGAQIEARKEYTTIWHMVNSPEWHINQEYRIKPDPDVVMHCEACGTNQVPFVGELSSRKWTTDNLKLTFDGTGKLIKAEVI